MKKLLDVGDQCVVNKDVDTQIYTITDIINGWAILNYQSGNRVVGGGEFPLSMLMTPSKQQLNK